MLAASHRLGDLEGDVRIVDWILAVAAEVGDLESFLGKDTMRIAFSRNPASSLPIATGLLTWVSPPRRRSARLAGPRVRAGLIVSRDQCPVREQRTQWRARKRRRRGDVITSYVNGVEVLSATDDRFPTGAPGVGFNFFVGNTNVDHGFPSFEVDTYD